MNSYEYIKEAMSYAAKKMEAINERHPATASAIKGIEQPVEAMIGQAYMEGAIKHDCDMVNKACAAYCKVCDTQECKDYEEFECSWLNKFEQTIKKAMGK